MAIHVVQIAGEEGRLVAAGAGANLHHAAGAIGVFAADRQIEQFVPVLLALGPQLGQLGLGQLAHLGVGALDHLERLGDLAVELLEAAILRGQLGQRAMLAGDRTHPVRIGEHRRIDELAFQFLEAGQFLFE